MHGTKGMTTHLQLKKLLIGKSMLMPLLKILKNSFLCMDMYTCTCHSQHVSLGIVKADAAAIRGELDKRKAELVNHMGAMGARM